MNDSISSFDLQEYAKAFDSERANLIAMDAVTANGIAKSARSAENTRKHLHQFSLRLKNKGMTSQKSSGRCWMFAALNCLRFRVIHDLNLENFELSQNYTLFYDKLEKANFFLESIFATLDEPTDSRLMNFLLRSPMQDGGQWDMISALIQKYGVVPKEAMPETVCSSGTMDTNKIITEKLRGYAADIRARYAAGDSIEELKAQKQEMLGTVYRMLCICLGTPPTTFDFEIRTKDDRFISERGLTPKEFYDRYIGVDLSDYISLINAPTEDKPYMHSYTVAYLGNVVGAAPVKYVNLPIGALKQAAIAQMQAGEPVWFGCDVGKMCDRDSGIMALDLYDYEALFHTSFDMTKADMLNYGHSKMSHAMVFQGVDLDETGSPIRWCVENSWGADCGDKGMYLMSDEWFDKYMYQVVVHKKHLPPDVVAAYEQQPIELAPWDPMGALA